jgi:2-polyprenyl-6-methoxyphenol hydroxylase-like FAD-dependent oxidoreductase
MKSPSVHRRHALIIGGSIGGMTAAKALSPHFDRITVLERDALTDRPEPRRGVPQGVQPHGLLPRGRRELEAMFPGLLQAVMAEGAFEFDGSAELARFTAYGWAPRHDNLGVSALACTRPLLETTMRRLLREQCANVRILDSTRFSGLVHERSGDEIIVTGAKTDSPDPALQIIDADLVIDATGRGTKSYKWMEEVGLPAPREIRVDAKCNYATRHYRAPAEAKHWWWRSLLIDSAPPDHARAVSILTVEGGRWIVTAIGTNGDYAPTDEAGWLDYIRSTRAPIVRDLLARAEPLTDVVQNRTTINIWRRMHEYQGKLSGLLLMGDGVCCFNPNYGQGLTSSALAARSLSERIAQHQGRLDYRFMAAHYQSQARWLEEGWTYSTTLDLRWPNAEGQRPAFYGFMRWCAALLESVALHDPILLRKLLPLLDFGANKLSILTPSFLARFYFGLFRNLISPRKLLSAHELDVFAKGTKRPSIAQDVAVE